MTNKIITAPLRCLLHSCTYIVIKFESNDNSTLLKCIFLA